MAKNGEFKQRQGGAPRKPYVTAKLHAAQATQCDGKATRRRNLKQRKKQLRTNNPAQATLRQDYAQTTQTKVKFLTFLLRTFYTNFAMLADNMFLPPLPLNIRHKASHPKQSTLFVCLLSKMKNQNCQSPMRYSF